MTNIKIRRAKESDAEVLRHLVKEFAQTQKAPPPDDRANFRLQLDAFSPNPPLDIWLAEIDGKPVGYAATYYTYSTFKGTYTLHLEDYFVLEDHQKKGIGGALLKHCTKIAWEKNCGRIDFLVLKDNPAIEIYQHYGAVELKDWTPYRFEGEQIEAIACQENW
ncbi:MAG TPA: GNAT family N-acetyltransferase [Cyanobacteria bacterium UBA11369]|nr:GNAT family N-acetyltransferase [Cyanobacteria bacterium UBA11371]HBE17648.1 GNAT family N-acetyltransferase [Cyanobacteria bacterium UBA11367]HBE35617.1 GNAT family N-acetyltransferase [Cyanobacteria bacterium UBA11368]HBE48997.1 GNAT family N-acetyltransferase [Cyanobacteria bacterium UBA11369]